MQQPDALFSIADRVILITGAAGGLGAAITRALAERGARVIVTDIEAGRAEALAGEFAETSGIVSRALDILDAAAIEEVVAETIERHGRLDGLINAAGVLPIAPIADVSSEALRETMDANFTGPFLVTRAVAAAIGRTGGRILHLASVSSLVANPNYTAYASSKAALSQMIRVTARELAPHGITVNAIGPALTDTPLTTDYLADPEFRANAIAHIPMGRLGLPEDLVGIAIFLMGPGAAFITGQTIYVDGGRTLV